LHLILFQKDMKTYIHNIKLAVIALAALAFTACGDSDEPTPSTPDTPRTILVYMLASNNLGDDSGSNFDKLDLDEMLTGAKNGALNGGRLLVYHADYIGDPQMKEVTPQGIITLKTYTDDQLSVSSARMANVLNDMKTLAPANDYGLILWGHATGWLQDGIDDPIDTPNGAGNKAPFYSYGYDHNSKNWMNTTTLARTLENRGLSFVYFDCCLMASIEALYELQDVSPKMVASATEVPGLGMPYQYTLPFLFSAGEADLEGASKAYFNYYKADPTIAGGCPVSTAVITTGKINALAAATKEIYAQAPYTCPAGYKGQLLYTNTNYYDFGHYIKAMAGENNALYAKWCAALDDVVGYKAASDYIWDIRPIEHFCGLSTYIIKKPSDTSNKNYNTLKWYADVVTALPL